MRPSCSAPRSGFERRSRRPACIPAFLLASLALAGCGGGAGERARGDFTIESLSSGTERITYRRLPDHELGLDTLAVWDLYAGQDYLFHKIWDAAGIPGGFVLLDGGNRQLVLVDRQGRFRAAAGRQGGGPGEFQYPADVETSGEEIWVADLLNSRYSVFTTGGAYLREVGWKEIALWGGSFAPLDDGRLLYQGEEAADLTDEEEVPTHYYLIRREPATGRADTLASMEAEPNRQIELRSSGGQAMRFVGPPQFAARMHWSAGPPGSGTVWVVTCGDYRVRQLDLEGQTIREIVMPVPDLRVTAQTRQRYFEANPPTFGFGSGETYEVTRQSLGEYPFAEVRAAVRGVRVDPVGRLWVQVSTEDLNADRLDVFTPGGRYLGSLRGVPLPMAFAPDGSALLRDSTDDSMDQFSVVALTGIDG